MPLVMHHRVDQEDRMPQSLLVEREIITLMARKSVVTEVLSLLKRNEREAAVQATSSLKNL